MQRDQAGTGKTGDRNHGAGISRCRHDTRYLRHSARQSQGSTPCASASCSVLNSRRADKSIDSSELSQPKNASLEWFFALSVSCRPDCCIHGIERDRRVHRPVMSFACWRIRAKLLPVRTPPGFSVPGPVSCPAGAICSPGTARRNTAHQRA